MQAEIKFDHFSSEEQAMAEIEAAGFHPVKIDFPAEENDFHWHDFEAMTYILDGVLNITERDSGESCSCTAGTRILAPSGLVHREQTEGYTALFGFDRDPAEFTQPINKPPQ